MANATVPPARIKICGLSTEDTLDAALALGVDWIGLVHFPRSPRHVELARADTLSRRAKGRAERVVLLVDPDDTLLADAVEAVDPDLIQLHGHESPERVAAIRALTGRPVMKALGLAGPDDLAPLAAYAAVADRILLDAKAPADAVLPGGNGRRFDWTILADRDLPQATMLSGGLDPTNVGEALARTRLGAVDVSSGVESAPGIKDPDRMAAFIAAARAAR